MILLAAWEADWEVDIGSYSRQEHRTVLSAFRNIVASPNGSKASAVTIKSLSAIAFGKPKGQHSKNRVGGIPIPIPQLCRYRIDTVFRTAAF